MGKLKFGASERAREAYAGLAMWADSPGGKKYPPSDAFKCPGMGFYVDVHMDIRIQRSGDVSSSVCVWRDVYIFLWIWVYLCMRICEKICG